MWERNIDPLPPIGAPNGDQTCKLFGVWDNTPTNFCHTFVSFCIWPHWLHEEPASGTCTMYLIDWKCLSRCRGWVMHTFSYLHIWDSFIVLRVDFFCIPFHPSKAPWPNFSSLILGVFWCFGEKRAIYFLGGPLHCYVMSELVTLNFSNRFPLTSYNQEILKNLVCQWHHFPFPSTATHLAVFYISF